MVPRLNGSLSDKLLRQRVVEIAGFHAFIITIPASLEKGNYRGTMERYPVSGTRPYWLFFDFYVTMPIKEKYKISKEAACQKRRQNTIIWLKMYPLKIMKRAVSARGPNWTRHGSGLMSTLNTGLTGSPAKWARNPTYRTFMISTRSCSLRGRTWMTSGSWGRK